jgi:Rap1a immunity proteins
MKLAASFAFFLGLCSAAQAEGYFRTGNQLYSECNSGDVTDVAMCLGYVMGILDQIELYADVSKTRTCIPANVTAGQVKDVVLKQMIEDPANRNLPASSIVFQAAFKAWGCAPPPKNQS